jgi:hypothetical protein
VSAGGDQLLDMSDEIVAVEPVVTAEKLRTLLAVGCELTNLDYKQRVDLDDHGELVELAKDIAAMRSCGGFLVIGADDQGIPTSLMDAALSKKFDEANLRQKLERFLHPTDVIPAQHMIDANHLVLIYVPRHRLGFTVVKAIGEYTKVGGGQKTVLRPGDVFMRRGTSSERWEEGVVERLLSPRDSALRETHRTEFAAMIAAIQAGAQGQAIAAGPVQSLTWQLDQASFDGAVVELLRRDDLVPIQLFLIRVPGDATAAADRGDRDDFGTILDRLVSVAAIALTLSRTDVATEVIERLADIYGSSAADQPGASPVPRPVYWLDILSRVVALGGLAVVLKRWAIVRVIALQASPETWYATWLRHGLTVAARTHAFPKTASGQEEQGALIPLARRVVHNLPALRPYAVDDEAYDPEPGAEIPATDAVLDSLCGFDALAALVVLTEIDDARFDAHHYYPSFGHYYSRRSEPLWARLLKDSAMRDDLLPGVDNDALGRAMAMTAEVAHSVVRGGWGLWEINDETIGEFVRDWRRKDADRKAAERDS